MVVNVKALNHSLKEASSILPKNFYLYKVKLLFNIIFSFKFNLKLQFFIYDNKIIF